MLNYLRTKKFFFPLLIIGFVILLQASIAHAQFVPGGGSSGGHGASGSWAPSPTGLVPCNGTADDPCTYEKFIQLVQNLLKYAIYISFPIAAIMFAYAGFLYLTAGGDTGKVKRAHSVFLNVGIGFIFILTAWLIVHFILITLIPPGDVGTYSALG